ncbi:hypothetical protein BGX21_011462 [Mortierella sp. AD011]|nr:hypothetical protein BGX20_003898 [Mortierella sp. AD010]KAF9402038.1 hypothetical protein BGX21_011462 [Mortierella sp. AD011]
MAFTAQSALLKFGFILSTVLFFLGLVELGSLAKYGTASSGIIAIASGLLFAMDFVTWKKSENYKGKRASLLVCVINALNCSPVSVSIASRDATTK